MLINDVLIALGALSGALLAGLAAGKLWQNWVKNRQLARKRRFVDRVCWPDNRADDCAARAAWAAWATEADVGEGRWKQE